MMQKEEYYIIRADKAGTYFCTLGEVDNHGFIELIEARKLYYWTEAISTEHIAVNGVGNNSKITEIVNISIKLSDIISKIKCSNRAIQNIKKIKPWKMKN